MISVHEFRELGATNYQHFLERTRGLLEGQDCVILACGPSLGDVSLEELEQFCAGKFVISVKQAFNHWPFAHLHILNTWNAQKYSYESCRPLVAYEKTATDPPVHFLYDLLFPIESASDISKQLAVTHDFDRYLLDRQLIRPWGPGILYELGFFFVAHFNPKTLTCFGWDIGAKMSPTMPHFYDKTADKLTREVVEALRPKRLFQRTSALHDLGLTYNRPRIVPEEVTDCAEVTHAWSEWFKGRGTRLQLCSDYSLAHESIPRIRVGEEVDHGGGKHLRAQQGYDVQ